MKRVTFDHPGLSRIFCNIHPNMAAHVMAVDTPYFAVADADGRSRLLPCRLALHVSRVAARTGGFDRCDRGRPRGVAVGDHLAMKPFIVLVGLAILTQATVASSQSVAVELNQTLPGASTEDVAAAATQIRAFGETAAGVRFMGESPGRHGRRAERTHLARPTPTLIAHR